jgi:hypothetical protein
MYIFRIFLYFLEYFLQFGNNQCYYVLLNDCIFVDYYFLLMSDKLNKEEQVQVVIRLKPVLKDLINTRSVYVSD